MHKPNAVQHNDDGTSCIVIIRKGVKFLCVIDSEDWPKLSQYRWNVQPDLKLSGRLTWRVYFSKAHIPLHRILGYDAADHINHDGLDNRKQNLRVATSRQQACNRRKRIGNYTSNYKGVHRLSNGRWRAKIDKQALGCYSTELEAAQAYNAAAKAKHGEFAVLNPIGG